MQVKIWCRRIHPSVSLILTLCWTEFKWMLLNWLSNKMLVKRGKYNLLMQPRTKTQKEKWLQPHLEHNIWLSVLPAAGAQWILVTWSVNWCTGMVGCQSRKLGTAVGSSRKKCSDRSQNRVTCYQSVQWECDSRNSLAVQRLGLHTSNCWGLCSVPDRGNYN